MYRAGYGRGGNDRATGTRGHPGGVSKTAKNRSPGGETGGLDPPPRGGNIFPVTRGPESVILFRVNEWLKQAAAWLVGEHGLAPSFADRIALFLAYCYQYGLDPVVQSGWRDPAHQKALRARWDAGDRRGLRARPALNSDHTRTNWLGEPAAEAIDITTANDGLAARIAQAVGIRAGQYFREPDPGHYAAA